MKVAMSRRVMESIAVVLIFGVTGRPLHPPIFSMQC